MGDVEDVVEAEAKLVASDLADVGPVQVASALGSFSWDRPSCSRWARARRPNFNSGLVRAWRLAVGGHGLSQPAEDSNPETMYLMTMYPVAVRSGRAGEEVVVMAASDQN